MSHVLTIVGTLKPITAPKIKSIITPKKILREKLLVTPKRRDGKTRAKIAFNSSPFLEMLFILKSLSTVNLSYHINFLYSNINLITTKCY